MTTPSHRPETGCPDPAGVDPADTPRSGGPGPGDGPDTPPDRGVVWVVCGDRRYLAEAIASARSLRSFHPELGTCLVVDRSLRRRAAEARLFDTVVEAEPPAPTHRDRHAFKVRHAWESSPFPETLFLDSDTCVVAALDGLFELLEAFDVCLTAAAGDRRPILHRSRPLAACRPYSSGVMLFRKTAPTEALFEEWLRLLLAQDDPEAGDQPCLMSALSVSHPRVYVLHNIWNAPFPVSDRYVERVRILHGRNGDVARIAGAINAFKGRRYWMPEWEACLYPDMPLRDLAAILARAVARRVRQRRDAPPARSGGRRA